MLGLYQCAELVGFDVKGVKINVDFLEAQTQPCILHAVIDGKLEHYITYYGINEQANDHDKKKYIIGDPRMGIVELSAVEFNDIWQSKFALLLAPNARFVKSENNLKDKWRWFRDVIRPDVNILAITIMLGVFITVLGTAIAIFYQKMIDDILPHAKTDKMIAGIVLLSVILISKSFLTFLRQHFILMQSKDFNERITGNFLSALYYLPKSFFDHRKTGDMTARLNDTQRIQKNIAFVVGTVCIDFIIVVVSLTVLFLYSVPVALLNLCFIPLIVFTVLSFIRPIKKQQKNVMVSYGATESNYVDNITGISAIKENNSEDLFIGRNKSVFGYFQDATLTLGNIGNRFTLASELLGVFILIGVILVSSYLVLNKQIKIGEMVAILSMAASLLPSVHRLAQSNLQIQEATVAFDRMYEFASVKPEFEQVGDKQETLNLEQLDVRNIAFGFPGRKLIMEDISFTVNKGEFIVLLGESGCGKSTILQLLQRFYYPERGDIFINERPVSQFYIPTWRNVIATVPQDIKLFNSSLAENIAMDKNASVKAVYEFCKTYGFDKYFSAFPQGYLTIVGEDGVNLSGGQKQLVAIARALFKKPQLLLLDEATSAMDRHTEQFILTLLHELREHMAVVMVTHRLNTVKNADRIYIVENGLIANEGSHSSLMTYTNLYSYTLAEYGL